MVNNEQQWNQPEEMYDSLEETDWIPPPSPDPEELPDNSSFWGPFYIWFGVPRKLGLPIALALTHEIHEPWHVGRGLMLRYGGLAQLGWSRKAVAVGLCKKGKPPGILEKPPTEEDLHKTVKNSWRLRRPV